MASSFDASVGVLRAAPEAGQTDGRFQGSNRTVWDGVFSEEQAGRGRQAYRRSCGQCHADDLSGGGDGEPPLKGPIFLAQWRGRSLAELFGVISQAMPYSAPGSLSTKEYADIVSYVFKANDASAGSLDLPGDPEALRQILISDPPSTRTPRQ